MKLTYLAPERIKPGSGPIGPESDLFSAGIVFWELLATKRLFKATMEHQVLSKLMHFQKAPIDYVAPEMNQFLEKLLAPNPDDRFHSANEALLALKSAGVQPCSQSEIALLVKEMKNYRIYKAIQAAQGIQAAGNVSAVPHVCGNANDNASDEPNTKPIEVDTIADGVNRFSISRYATIGGLLLLVIAFGALGVWQIMAEESPPHAKTIQERIETSNPKGSNDVVKTSEVETGIVMMKSGAVAPDTETVPTESDSATEKFGDYRHGFSHFSRTGIGRNSKRIDGAGNNEKRVLRKPTKQRGFLPLLLKQGDTSSSDK